MNAVKTRSPAEGLWLLASFATLAASGLLLNLLIAFLYGSEALGLFNLAYAVYIFAAQLAVLGQQQAAIYYVSVHSREDKGRHMALAALFCGLGLSLPVGGALFLLRHALAAVMEAPELALAVLCMLPGLFFFSGDKVLLATLNAQNRVAAYAHGTMLRYGAMLAFVALLAVLDAPAWSLPVSFSLAEGCVFLHLIRVTAHHLALPRAAGELPRLMRASLFYGLRGFASGLIAELNSRVDILVLGLFVPMAQVGVYSFVALIAEGIGQLPLLGRIYNDPILARLWAGQQREELLAVARKSRLLAWAIMSAICVLAFLAVYFFVLVLPGGAEYRTAMPAFAVLLAGVALASGYAPLSGILQQAGYPGLQSSQVAAAFALNVVLCLCLAPVLGILGAAVSLACSQLGGVLALRWLARKRLGMAI